MQVKHRPPTSTIWKKKEPKDHLKALSEHKHRASPEFILTLYQSYSKLTHHITAVWITASQPTSSATDKPSKTRQLKWLTASHCTSAHGTFRACQDSTPSNKEPSPCHRNAPTEPFTTQL